MKILEHDRTVLLHILQLKMEFARGRHILAHVLLPVELMKTVMDQKSAVVMAVALGVWNQVRIKHLLFQCTVFHLFTVATVLLLYFLSLIW